MAVVTVSWGHNLTPDTRHEIMSYLAKRMNVWSVSYMTIATWVEQDYNGSIDIDLFDDLLLKIPRDKYVEFCLTWM
jgi:hypothetical protein